MPLKASEFQKLLVMLEGEPFTEILALPSLGAGQPVEVSQVTLIFFMSFTSSSRKRFSRKSQSMPDPKGPVQVPLQGHGEFCPIHLQEASACPGRRHCCSTGFVSLRDAQHSCTSLTTHRSGPCPPEPHYCRGNRSPEGRRCRRLTNAG